MATGLVKRWGVISQQRSAIAEIATRKCAYQYAVSTRDVSALVVAVLSVSLRMARWGGQYSRLTLSTEVRLAVSTTNLVTSASRAQFALRHQTQGRHRENKATDSICAWRC
jgi:hypothetical protein